MADAKTIDGKAFALGLRQRVAAGVADFVGQGHPKPGLATVLVGADPASQVYVRSKGKLAVELGMTSIDRKLPAETTEQELLALIAELNADPAVNGILVQLPLPKHIDTAKVLLAIDPAKDVDGFHPINVGRLAAEKNLGLTLKAFEEIKKVRPDARLLFVGDGPEKARLAAQHPQHIYAGMRRGEDLAAHDASADLFLFPSLTETFGNVTSEALASGLGVVAYACAAAEELIDDGISGLLAPPEDETTFIQSAALLASDPVLLPAIRLRAAPSVQHLDWERVHDSFTNTLDGLISAHQRRQRDENALITASN